MDYLFGTPYEIRQEKGMYHFSSDSELLGRFLDLSAEDTVLDIGTNNGVLLLYASLHKPASLAGIDLFEEVITLARENLNRYGIAAEFAVSRLQDYEHGPFRAVICNPPFFTNQNDRLKKENPYLRAARHSDNLSLEDLFLHAKRLLKDEGKLFLVYPSVDKEAFHKCAEDLGFTLTFFRKVYDKRGGRELRELALYRKTKTGNTEEGEPVYLDELHNSEKSLAK